jgi:transcriptional regulator GlxA family with amidase domain
MRPCVAVLDSTEPHGHPFATRPMVHPLPASSRSLSSRVPPSREVRLRVGFLLAPRFTLVAFAGFIDVLRLAADEGDRSRQRICTWSILGTDDEPVVSSCGASVRPTAPMEEPEQFDYLVVVGGLLHDGQKVSRSQYAFLREAASKGVKLVGLCTGSFILARAGLLEGHLACVSWFHREAFVAEFPQCRVISNQMFVVDRDRLTCAGGTSVVHLAAYLIEKSIDRASAVKAMRIMIEEQPLPSRTLQPEEVLSERSFDSVVHKAMLLIEQDMQSATPIEALLDTLGIGPRQLERRFKRDIGLSPAQYRQKLRLERARWLLHNTDLDIMEVGLECGFQDATNFARAVRRAFGTSPREVRAARGQSPV